MTTQRIHDDYIATLLANVQLNEYDRRNAESDFRHADRIANGLIRLFEGTRKLARTFRSGFATTAKATPQ